MTSRSPAAVQVRVNRDAVYRHRTSSGRRSDRDQCRPGTCIARLLAAALVISAVATASTARAAWPLGPLGALSSLDLAIDGHLIDSRRPDITAQPGSTLALEVLGWLPKADRVLDTSNALHAERQGHRHWRIHVGETPGVYRLAVRNRATGATRPVTVFVPEPFDTDTRAIDGYRIGHYQTTPRADNPIYNPPTALLRIGGDDVGTHLSPHFTVGQFLCHQQPHHWPKFALIRPRLVDKLEAILAALRGQGIDAGTLTVMSGYRTPHYNAAIGNTTVYSRHLYGGAADIFVDTDHDGQMDDLNGDGVIDVHDAQWLADRIARLDAARPRLVGGLSAYPATAAHGPFVHVDVRGAPVRW